MKEISVQMHIVQSFADVMRQQNISLRAAEKITGMSDTYISQVVSTRKEPSQRFLVEAVKVIAKYK